MLDVKGFLLTELIYEGSRSRVYRGRAQDDNRPVICKVLNAEYPSAEACQGFEREFQLLHKLQHRGVIKGYQIVSISNSLGIVMEDVGGESLAKRISAQNLRFDEKLSIACKLAEALAYVHSQGIIHKDINPSNIVVEPSGLQAVIIDFGISSQLTSEYQEFTDVRTLEGTLHYISPEQTGRMNRDVDQRSDLYSLGITLYEMFASVKPFPAENLAEVLHCHIAKKANTLWEVDRKHPKILSQIIEKLMEKDADDRYQTAIGLLADLRKCEELLASHRESETIELGLEDPDDRFEIPQFLYGREKEIETIAVVLEDVCRGASALLFVCGYSGVGKTAVIRELHRTMSHVERHYCSGKFDRFNQSIPYSGIVQALSVLIKHTILMGGEDEIVVWRKRLIESLSSNLSLVTTLIPELGTIVGGDSPSEVPVKGNESRFHFALLNLIRCLTQNKPLILFLDDLQWADPSSFRMIQVLLRDPDLKSILVIGAYRSNEVDSMHPLVRLRNEFTSEGRAITELVLAPLLIGNVCDLLMDTLHLDQEAVLPLAEMLMNRTGGNPFFINQLLMAMHEEDIIRFDLQAKKWIWDSQRIDQAAVPDNVVDLMIKKINRMSPEAVETLMLAACIGSSFDLMTLSIIAEASVKSSMDRVLESIRLGLILPLDQKYKAATPENASSVCFRFLHDRVQQAAYSLLDENNRSLYHLKIGRILQKTQAKEVNLFDIVQHMNKGRTRIDDERERRELASLNRKAAKKAKISAAYHSAVEFLSVAEELLAPEGWTRAYDAYLQINQELLEALCLDAQYERVHQLGKLILSHAQQPLDALPVYLVEPSAYISESKPADALRFGLSGLRDLQLLPRELKKDKLSIRKALFLARLSWRRKQIPQLKNQPDLTDPATDAIVKILGRVMSACYFSDPLQLVINTCLQVRLAIKKGHSSHASKGYVTYGMILCSRIGDLQAGYEFGKLALQLSQKSKFDSSSAEVGFLYNGFLRHSHEPLRDCVTALEQNYLLGLETGEIEFAAYTLHNLSMLPFTYGENLQTILANTEKYTSIIATKLQHNVSADMNRTFWQAYLNLTGQNSDPLVLKGEAFDEDKMVPIFTMKKHKTGLYMIYFVKTMLSYLLQDTAHARKYADLAKANQAFLGHPNHLLLNFFDSLILIDDWERADSEAEKKRIRKLLRDNQKRLGTWARTGPMNYQHRCHLIEAEIARLEGDISRAEKLYDQVLIESHENGFLWDEALASELLARFWREQGKAKIAHVYLREAHHLYGLWGAKAKVRHLESKHPHLAHQHVSHQEHSIAAHTATGRYVNSAIDTDTVVTASQTIAGETDISEIVRRLMKLTIENAGAQKGCLLLVEEGSLMVKALALTHQEVHVSVMNRPLKSANDLPKTLINFVSRSSKHLVINNPSQEGDYAQDPYIISEKPKSIVCMPIRFQSELVGMLYLENKNVIGAFTDKMISVLTILATQGAISIINARHVGKLKDMVEHIQELVDEKTRHIASVMKHIKQGIFTILPNLSIEESYSDNLELIFEDTRMGGTNPMRLLRKTNLSEDEISRIEHSLTISLGANHLNFEINQAHLPSEVTLGSKLIELDWQNIVEAAGNTEKVLVVARDVTDVRRLEQEAQQQREDMLRIEEILAHPPEIVQNFFAECSRYLTSIESFIQNNRELNSSVLHAVFVNYHTLKGLARAQKFKLMVDSVHTAEKLCAEILQSSRNWDQNKLNEDLQRVNRALDNYKKLSREKLGRSAGTGIHLDQAIIGKALAFIERQPFEKRLDIQDVERALQASWYVSAAQVVEKLEKTLPDLATELGKAMPRVELTGARVDFTPQTVQLLRAVFVHLVRNSLDHGLEAINERRKSGKQDAGVLRFHCLSQGNRLEIHYSDDGAGLNLARIRQLGMERGLIQSEVQDPLTLAYLICETGFSTAQTVSLISGRGIGMDAVKSLIEEHGGTFVIRFLKPCHSLDQPVPFEVVISLPAPGFLVRDEATSMRVA